MLRSLFAPCSAPGVARTGALVVYAAMLIGLATACATKPTQVDVPMAYKPTATLPSNVFTSSLPETKIYVAAIGDKRDKQELIGENQEDAATIAIRAADKTPPEFVHDALVDNLRAAGLEVVDSSAAADRVIDGDLTRFWTAETNLYRTEVRTVFSVRNKAGSVVWKGSEGGAAKRFGRSLSVGNYQQVYSDATLQMIGNLLANPGFQEALVKKQR